MRRILSILVYRIKDMLPVAYVNVRELEEEVMWLSLENERLRHEAATAAEVATEAVMSLKALQEEIESRPIQVFSMFPWSLN